MAAPEARGAGARPAPEDEYSPHRVAVIGSGIIGLSSAVCITRNLAGVNVTVISDQDQEDTTSYGAGGLWEPYSLGEGQDPNLVKRWGRATFEHLERESRSADAGKKGVFRVTANQFFEDGPENHPDPFWADIVPRFAHANADELSRFPPHVFQHGWVFSSIVCEPRRYMPWLETEFLATGGRFVRQRITDVQRELAADYDLVVNCTGLGARRLTGDRSVQPVQGQVLRVNAPEIKQYYGFGETTYIIPNTDTVVLGGSTDRCDPDTTTATVDEELSRSILDRCSAYLPSLRAVDLSDTSVVKWAGLRPVRRSIRLEVEESPPATADGRRTVPIVHNYGHGGSGVTLFWGCAEHTVELVRERLKLPTRGALKA